MQALILCGGKGTRLRSVIGERQKTMTKVGSAPFLVNVINYLKSYKITNVIFATGYKSHEVRDYFGEKYFFGVEASYSEEKISLGTGGAIRNAFSKLKYDEVLVVNGDTLFEANLNKLKDNFKVLKADMSIACKAIDDKSRYGTIKISFDSDKNGGNKDQGVIVSFDEKVNKQSEDNSDLFINGGIYIIKKSLIATIPQNEKLSLEKDLIPKWIAEGKLIGGVVSEASFIDIGTPESLGAYKRSQDLSEDESLDK